MMKQPVRAIPIVNKDWPELFASRLKNDVPLADQARELDTPQFTPLAYKVSDGDPAGWNSFLPALSPDLSQASKRLL